MATLTRTPDLTVAQTILEQLGGHKFRVITGAKNLTGTNNSLSMRVNGRIEAGAVNAVRITLDPSDTYTVASSYLRAGNVSPRHSESGIYDDMLRDAFTRATGLYTSLGTMGSREGNAN